MRQRTFIAALGSAAAWPVMARAQQSLPVVGYVNGASATGGRRHAGRAGKSGRAEQS